MELTQPVESDSNVLRLDHVNKNRSTKREHHVGQSRVIHSCVLKLDKPIEKEIHLHIEADQIHEGVELDNKSDPVWEPWRDKTVETKPRPVKPVPKEAEPMIHEETIPQPQSLDPDLAAEARLHSQAVANITK